MKALTLWQPWASLIALGVKTIETRSWSTDYRGPIAIHAAKRPPDAPGYEDGCRFGEIFGAQLESGAQLGAQWSQPIGIDAGWTLYASPTWDLTPMPLGAVVAVAQLVGCVPTDDVYFDGTPGSDFVVHLSPGRTSVHSQSGNEPFGDFSPGRFAWLHEDIKPLVEPVPAVGRQGLWEWTSPSLVAEANHG